MEVKNGIIIDGVLHEFYYDKSKSCNECTMEKLCKEHDVPLCIMFGCYGFVNRGKAKVEVEVEKEKTSTNLDLSFEIGELVMMRTNNENKWIPKHYARYIDYLYESMDNEHHSQCAKFDKDIVFTNKPAKKK